MTSTRLLRSKFRAGVACARFLTAVSFGLCLLTAACSESSGPIEAPPAFVKGEPLRHGLDAPALLTDSASFAVVQGEGDTLVVFYDNPRTPEPDEGDWFVKLVVPGDAQYVDVAGNPRTDGDSVVITLDIDPQSYSVRLEPHGSTFPGDAAVLCFNYKYADLRGRDARNLHIWYQGEVGDTWTAQATTFDQRGFRIFADLAHFSNYSIAW
jgi:hypothetical protein